MARYTPEFKKEAVELYESGGAGIKRTADGLGIAPETLRHWVKQSRDAGQLDITERERMRQMETENALLREENEIQKKPPRTSPRRQRKENDLRFRGRRTRQSFRLPPL